MSFDNIGDRLEYVRHGASWDLLQNNLKTVKYLMQNNQHWGGVHAVYNIYSATRLCEFRQFTEESGVSVLWQNLFQPDYLDPFLHGPVVAESAAKEIEKFYAMGIATPAERQFFDTAFNNYINVTEAKSNVGFKFAKHIGEIEHQYHPDKLGEFKRLWPEFATLC